jgi:hypothetical protein
VNTHLYGAGDSKAAEDRKQRQAEARERLEAAKKDSKTK